MWFNLFQVPHWYLMLKSSICRNIVFFPTSQRCKVSTCVPLISLLNGHQYHFPLQYMAKRMLMDSIKKKKTTQFQVGYMSFLCLKQKIIPRSSPKIQRAQTLLLILSDKTGRGWKPKINFYLSNFFYDNRITIMFKVLVKVIYRFFKSDILTDYLCLHQEKWSNQE